VYAAYPGPLTIDGCRFQDFGPGNPQRVLLAPGGTSRGRAQLLGNSVETSASSPVQIGGTGNADFTLIGNIGFNKASGEAFAFADVTNAP
jgi:hypothetical protein